MRSVDEWELGPIPDPKVGNREWSYVTNVEVECPRCGMPEFVPVVVYATTDGGSMVTMHTSTSANPAHDCDVESARVLDLDGYVDPNDESFVVIQPYADSEPEVGLA